MAEETKNLSAEEVGIFVEKIKAFCKYVFVSNPITIFAGILSLAILIANGAAGGVIAETLLGWLNDPTAITATFHTLIGGLGLFGATMGGLETNKQADERKAREAAEAEQAANAQAAETKQAS